MTSRWHKVSTGLKPDPLDKQVLLGVDDEVMAGKWNAQRKLWFCGERPVFPQWWREMPTLPKRLTKCT